MTRAAPPKVVSDGPRAVVRRLANGVTLVIEPSARGRVIASEVVVRAGAAHDPNELPGATALTLAWAARGAGGRSARERQDAFARLGARTGGGAGRDRSVLSLRAPDDAWPEALRLLADELARPDLNATEFAVARRHARHDRAARDDDPAARLDALLSGATLAPPFDRDPYGSDAGLSAATPDAVRAHARTVLRPERVTVVVTGAVHADAATAAAEAAFGAWRVAEGAVPDAAAPGTAGGGDPAHDRAPEPEPALAPPTKRRVPDPELQQVQLGFAWPLLPAHDPRVAAQSLGLAVLSEGTGARLFAQVRERYGLAYAVHARAVAMPGIAWGEAFAATGPGRATEAERLIRSELRRLADGVDEGELDRARTQLRTQEAMRAETAGGRAAQIVRDLTLLGRVRTPEERDRALRTPDRDTVNAALRAAPCHEPTVVTLGGTFGGTQSGTQGGTQP